MRFESWGCGEEPYHCHLKRMGRYHNMVNFSGPFSEPSQTGRYFYAPKPFEKSFGAEAEGDKIEDKPDSLFPINSFAPERHKAVRTAGEKTMRVFPRQPKPERSGMEVNMAVFTGAGVAIVTPFHEDGSVNYEKFAEHIEAQIAGGTDAVIVCGTTGESSTLTHEEHLEVIRYCVEKTAGRIPVIAGTGSNCTETAVYLSREAEKAGVDGVLLVTPYYNKATQKGLYEHFRIIAEAIHIPVILYNIPGRTGGVNILPETVVKLCREVPNIVGVKDATGNISQVAKLMSLAGGDVDVYSGNDDQVVPLLSLGAKGVISVLSNVAPRQTHDMCAKFFEGDVEGSRKIQLDAIPLIDALFSEVNPIPVKKAMNLMGMEAGPLRRPLTEMEEEHAAQLEKAMKEFGIL